MISRDQIKQFNKEYKSLFLETEKGNPLPRMKRKSLIKTFIVDTIFYLIISFLCFVLYNYKEYLLIGSLILFGYPLAYYFSKRITRKTPLIENQILSEKLEEFISRIQIMGLKISTDAKSEQEAGEKPSLLVPSEISSINPGSPPMKIINQINKNNYYIQPSNGFKIEQTPRTPEQERYAEFLQSAKNIETEFSGNPKRFGKWGTIILLIILIILGISIISFIVVKNFLTGIIFLMALITLIIYIAIHGVFHPLNSGVYVKSLIIQNKIPLKKIKIGAYSHPYEIYLKIKQRKTHEKHLKRREKSFEKYNERMKNPPKGIKKVFLTILVFLILIGALAGFGLLIYGMIWLLGHIFTF